MPNTPSMQESIAKANILIESLPYIRDFYNKIVVIKYGGNAMVDEDLKKSFALNVILMKYIGINPVIVHGGGPQINKVLEQMNIASSFVEGMRVTDGETMDVVEMVLVGKVNKEIVGMINKAGGKAVGLSGRDGDLISAKKLSMHTRGTEDAPSEIIDLGRVGEVIHVNPDVIYSLDTKGFIPVIAPVGVGNDGQSYNINADLVAGAVASKLHAEKLVLLTDVPGVMDRDENLLPSLTDELADEYMATGVIAGGMIPKVRCCQQAVRAGVTKAHIIDGRIEHALLLEIFTRQGIGTEIYS